MKIKHLFYLSAIFSLLSGPLSAQTSAKWLSVENRERNFPNRLYVSGFSSATQQPDESVSDVLKRAVAQAAEDAVNSIRTQIQSVSENRSTEVEANGELRFQSTYSDYVRMTSDAQLVGLHTENYFDEQSQVAHAFCYAKRATLVEYYASQVELNLSAVDDAIAQAGIAARSDQKPKARTILSDALKPLAKAEYARDLLTALSPANSSVLQQARFSKLKTSIFQQLTVLEQNIFVYIDAVEKKLNNPSTLMTNKLRSILAKNRCTFCSDSTQADFCLTIKAITRKHDVANQTFKFVYADVTLDLYSRFRGMSIFQDEFSVKGGSSTFSQAAQSALKEVAPKIWERIKPWILGE